LLSSAIADPAPIPIESAAWLARPLVSTGALPDWSADAAADASGVEGEFPCEKGGCSSAIIHHPWRMTLHELQAQDKMLPVPDNPFLTAFIGLCKSKMAKPSYEMKLFLAIELPPDAATQRLYHP
jgi:hypothetical protein